MGRDATELVIASVPLGGYVKMLDEREGEVAPAERHRAFNRQPLATRFAVVLAGPVFNLLFAIFAYWVMYISGVPGLRPVIGEVLPSSYAEQAGFVAGDEILAINDRDTPSWESVVLSLLDAGLAEQGAFQVRVLDAAGNEKRLQVRVDDSSRMLGRGALLDNFGLKPWRPAYPAVIDQIFAGQPAERAGLLPGDRIVAVDGTTIRDWNQWVDYVRGHPARALAVQVERDGVLVELEMTPAAVQEDGSSIGRIGASVKVPDTDPRATMRVVVRYGPLAAVPVAFEKTWEMTTLTLRTLWKMISGKASVENLSGPISIAQYAGQSAAIGFAAFLGFLAIVSISLGVLNLLPIPILDGGHLMYYLVELVKGSPVSETAQLLGQRVGIMLLLLLMMLAFYNDLARLFG